MSRERSRRRKRPESLPVVESEEDELRFWDEHDPSDFAAGPADVIVKLKRARPRKMVSLRLDVPLYEELRRVARAHDLPYQQLMRELLRNALTRLAVESHRKPPAVGRHGPR
jgi:predicted DNA binding CopG/RHH family protein